MDFLSAVVTLFLIMDPLGNIPLYLAALRAVAPERRRKVLVREVMFAYALMLGFLFLGNYILVFLHLEQETISVAGGIVLFIIAVRMIFPGAGAVANEGELPQGEPFLVPLAVPLFAGPSVLAALLLMQRAAPADTRLLLAALTVAWAVSSVILLSSTFFYRILRERGLIAVERLMGMLLVMISVQMLMTGLKTYFQR